MNTNAKYFFLTIMFLNGCSSISSKPGELIKAPIAGPVSEKILFIADNQERMLLGRPLLSMSNLTEKYVTSVSLRSPLSNVGGLNLLKSALSFAQSQDVTTTIHLGDASDISCPDELTSVFDSLDKYSAGQWYMALGNHDGLLAGTYTKYQPSSDYVLKESIYVSPPNDSVAIYSKSSWLAACVSPDNWMNPDRANVLTKGDAISMYLSRLKNRSGTVSKYIKTESVEFGNTSVICDIEEITIASEHYSAISRICPRTPVKGKTTWVGPYASYLVQKIDFLDRRMVFVDTSSYTNPSLKNVGLSGSLEFDQRQMSDYLFGGTKRDKVIIVGHHPMKDLSDEDKEWIIANGSKYMSAHAHVSAELIAHSNDKFVTKELNIGSMIDYPTQAVLMNLDVEQNSFRVVGADVANTAWPGYINECEKQRDSWKIAEKFYTSYTKNYYIKHLISAMNEANYKAPEGQKVKIPSGDRLQDWDLLQQALVTIHDFLPEKMYWACQAYYGSEATANERGWFEKIISAFFYSKPKGTDAVGAWYKF